MTWFRSKKKAAQNAPEESSAENTVAETPAESAADEVELAPHLAGGPFDISEKPEDQFIDLGGILVPMIPGMELRMEQDQATGTVTSANLILEGSALQVQAFAAPKTAGIWEEVRAALRDGIVEQGGTAEKAEGPFGDELKVRLPYQGGNGKLAFRNARFLGIDGPRWFLRAVISGPALNDAEDQQALENILSRIVVIRGDHAMPPQELIPLRLPEQEEVFPKGEDFNPLEQGPTIAEVR